MTGTTQKTPKAADTFKQGRARKVNERNFYLMCEYLKIKILFPMPDGNSLKIVLISNYKLIENTPSIETLKEYIES